MCHPRDASQLAFSSLHWEEKGSSACRFLSRAVLYIARREYALSDLW